MAGTLAIAAAIGCSASVPFLPAVPAAGGADRRCHARAYWFVTEGGHTVQAVALAPLCSDVIEIRGEPGNALQDLGGVLHIEILDRRLQGTGLVLKTREAGIGGKCA